MEWSIYVEGQNFEDDTWVVDISTDAPDGVYPVVFPYINVIGNGNGVTVKDGEFVLEPTMEAIEHAVQEARYWGKYIEGLTFEKDYNRFVVSIGS